MFSNAVEPLYNRHHRDLEKMSIIETCLLHRVLLKLTLLLQIPALRCIGTAHPSNPICLPLLKLVKSIGQRQCVIATQ